MTTGTEDGEDDPVAGVSLSLRTVLTRVGAGFDSGDEGEAGYSFIKESFSCPLSIIMIPGGRGKYLEKWFMTSIREAAFSDNCFSTIDSRLAFKKTDESLVKDLGESMGFCPPKDPPEVLGELKEEDRSDPGDDRE